MLHKYQIPLVNWMWKEVTIGTNFAGTSPSPSNGFIVEGATSIGTMAPNASAKLDVSSTTQGFLPPRMTFFAERNAIVNPAQGLIVYCTNCGTNGETHMG